MDSFGLWPETQLSRNGQAKGKQVDRRFSRGPEGPDYEADKVLRREASKNRWRTPIGFLETAKQVPNRKTLWQRKKLSA